jgi:adenylate kinase
LRGVTFKRARKLQRQVRWARGRALKAERAGAALTDDIMDNLSVSTSRLSRLRTVRRAANLESRLNLVLFGPPGAGKGTQADRIAQQHRIPKISTGDMLRKAVQDGTCTGAIVRDTLQSGALVGDDLMIPLVGERLEHPDTARGFVLDGFPRTIPQAAALDALLAARGPVKVIALVVHADEVIRRLAGRRREDDDACVIKERLAVYARDTEPVLEYYRRRGAVTILDGNRPMDAVTDAIERELRTQIRR